MEHIQINSSVDLSVNNDYYYGDCGAWCKVDSDSHTLSTRDILDRIDIKEIEQYIREKKLRILKDKDE